MSPTFDWEFSPFEREAFGEHWLGPKYIRAGHTALIAAYDDVSSVEVYFTAPSSNQLSRFDIVVCTSARRPEWRLRLALDHTNAAKLARLISAGHLELHQVTLS